MEKARSRISDPSKYLKPLGKVTVHYIDNGSKTNPASNHKMVQMNLDEYFEKAYFSKLSGLAHKELYDKLEPYIKEIVMLDEQNSQIEDSWIPLEYQGINTKEKLLASIKKLEKINRKQFIK